MREHVPLLYLGCSVLAIVDEPALRRFWMLLELWLAHQEAASNGLVCAEPEFCRCEIVCLRGTPRTIEASLGLDGWAVLTPKALHTKLHEARYVASRAADKALMLPSVMRLDRMARELDFDISDVLADPCGTLRMAAERLGLAKKEEHGGY